MNRVIAFILFYVTAIPAFAELPPKFKEWGAGPAQWIMTSDEKRAWRKVTTESDAVNFIDLFWARRDPSSGTAVNEFRNEFESRVAFSDETFIEKRRRGAMTDRGRVYIVLGAATNMDNALRQTNAQLGLSDTNDESAGGGRQRGARAIWTWNQVDARKFDMGKIEVVFVEDATTGRMLRDPQRTDFGLAGPVAVKKALVNPDLTAVPAWAMAGGLEPAVFRLGTAEIPATATAPAPSPTTSSGDDAPLDDGPAVASKAPGASRLTLLPDGPINARSSTDPFAVHAETPFKSGKDGQWAVQFCAAEAALPKLKFMVLIAGPLDGPSTDRCTIEKDAKPERMTATPGCYVLQGTMPISKLTAGRYKLTVLIDDSATGDAHSVKGEFRVE